MQRRKMTIILVVLLAGLLLGGFTAFFWFIEIKWVFVEPLLERALMKMGWPTGFEPATTSSTSLDSTS